MMYFLYKSKTSTSGSHFKICASNTKTWYELEKADFDLCGQFGRLDYARHWANYKNGKISQKEHMRFLGLS